MDKKKIIEIETRIKCLELARLIETAENDESVIIKKANRLFDFAFNSRISSQ